MRKQDILLYLPELATQFISEFEQGPKGGPALESYKCPAGVWTIGFGHTKDVHPGEHITRNEAYDLLTKDGSNTGGARSHCQSSSHGESVYCFDELVV